MSKINFGNISWLARDEMTKSERAKVNNSLKVAVHSLINKSENCLTATRLVYLLVSFAYRPGASG